MTGEKPLETPSPDVMEVWEAVFEAWDNDPVTPYLGTEKVDRSVATVIAEAKARWEREAFEKAARVAEKWIDEVMATDHENNTYRSIALVIRALSENSQ